MRILIALSITLASASSAAHDLTEFEVVDLSHPYNDRTLYWPTSPSRFSLEKLAYGINDAGWFYASNSICTPEHGGTHLDAPIHFGEHGQTVDQLPLRNLLGHAVVVDVSASAAKDPEYRLTVADIETFERSHGRIAPGAIVLLRTGWSRFWPDAKTYLGDDTPGDASNLRFPSFGKAAAQLLVEKRKVAVLGVDTASIDFGPSTDFEVHRVAAKRNVAGLENLTNLENVPASGAQVIALPMKIEGGSGAPVRVIALIPRNRAAQTKE